LVGVIHGLGVVSNRSIHDGDTLGAGVSPATSRGRSGEARYRASLSTGTHVVCPVEAFCKTKISQHNVHEFVIGESTPAAPEKDTNLDDPARRRSGPKSSSPRLRLLLRV
jgi:hypothetical protein